MWGSLSSRYCPSGSGTLPMEWVLKAKEICLLTAQSPYFWVIFQVLRMQKLLLQLSWVCFQGLYWPHHQARVPNRTAGCVLLSLWVALEQLPVGICQQSSQLWCSHTSPGSSWGTRELGLGAEGRTLALSGGKGIILVLLSRPFNFKDVLKADNSSHLYKFYPNKLNLATFCAPKYLLFLCISISLFKLYSVHFHL